MSQRKPRVPRRSSLSIVVTAPGDTPNLAKKYVGEQFERLQRKIEHTNYRRTKIGDCTCGYGFPDLLIGATSPPTIVVICPECGEQRELGLTRATRESLASVLDEKAPS